MADQTAFIDGDIYEELDARAASDPEAKGKYQTLMNKILRDALFESETKEVAEEFELTRLGRAFDKLFKERNIERKIQKMAKQKVDQAFVVQMKKTPHLYGETRRPHGKATRKKA